MDEEQEIDLFAEEMFIYLFARRMGIHNILSRQTMPNDVHHFTNDVGKAVLMACCRYQKEFWQKFIDDGSLPCAQDVDACMSYCIMTVDTMFNEPKTEDVFISLFITGAMILEMASFFSWYKFEGSKKLAKTCWVRIFLSIYKRNFFENGGWQSQRERAQECTRFYDLVEYEKPLAPGLIEEDRRLLTRCDNVILKDKSVVIVMVPSLNIITDGDRTQQMSNELQQPEIGIPSKDKSQEFIKSSKLKEIVETPSYLGSPSIECDGGERTDEVLDFSIESLSSIETYSTQQMGAIPKLQKVTDKASKTISPVPSSSKAKFLDSFMNIMIRDENMAGKKLFEFVKADLNIEHLMIDEDFCELMEKAVKNPENKSNNAMLKETALSLILKSIPKESSHVFDGSLHQTYDALNRKSTAEEEFSDDQHTNIRSLDNVPTLHSPPKETPENVLGDEGLNKNDTNIEMLKFSGNSDIYSNKFASKDVTFGYTGSEPENKTQEIESTESKMVNFKINDSGLNKLASDFPKNQFSTRRCKEENKNFTKADVITTLGFCNSFTISKDGIEYIYKEPVDRALWNLIECHIKHFDELDKFDLSDKIKKLKCLLRNMSCINLELMNNVIQLSHKIIHLVQTPKEFEFADALNTSIRNNQRNQMQTTFNIANNKCDCCISEKMNILEELAEITRYLILDEMDAKEKLSSYKIDLSSLSDEETSFSLLGIRAETDMAARLSTVKVEKDHLLEIQDIKKGTGRQWKKNKKKSRKRKK